nr:DapH/DapD/GlmU-related protein [Arthrobacter luteolus]
MVDEGQILNRRLETLTNMLEKQTEALREITARIDLLESKRTGLHHMNPNIEIAEDAAIDPTVTIMAPDSRRKVVLLKASALYRDTEIRGPFTLGKRSFINRGGFIQGDVQIGTSVAIGPFVRLITDNHFLGPESRRAGQVHTLPIRIGNGVWIGASVTILGGVTISDGAIVAAGAVVTRDVAPNTLVGGVPARAIRTLS